MELAVRHEPVVDYDETARLASAGFGVPDGSFSPDKLRRLYEHAFSHGSTVLSLYAGDRKVGQVALVHQRVAIGGRIERAVALVDLFILKEVRSREAIGSLYGEVERFCLEEDIRFIIGVPNPQGAKVNIRYLKLAPLLRLDIRAGVARPWAGRRIELSKDLQQFERAEALALFGRYLPMSGVGLHWTSDSLWERLQDGTAGFGVHATDDLLLISSPRVTRRVPHTLLCCLLPRPGRDVSSRAVAAVVAAACRMHRRPVFVYAGINEAVPLPGLSLPERLRPSPMVVQARDFGRGAVPVVFTHFELLDFDFA